MWGMSVAFWEIVFRWATILALMLGGLTATAAFISVWVGYQLTSGVQQEANRRVSEIQAEAARANEAAAKANERAAIEAARAQAEAGHANAGANISIAKINAELAEARKQTAMLEREASQARLEQLRLKALLAWRTLSPSAASALRSQLSATPAKINIEYVHSDVESQYFAVQIANTFVDARWNVAMVGVVYDGSLVFGMAVPDSRSPETVLVRKAFEATGIEFDARDVPRSARVHGTRIDTSASIFVGSKPAPSPDRQKQ
jgi:hypothetical protein